MSLTDSACRNAKPEEKPRKLADSGGLYLQIVPNGSRYWRMKYRMSGKEKLLALGVYPETTLAEAREKRDQARKLIANGVDPAFEKKEQKRIATLNSENTFEAITREWHQTHLEKWSEGHGKTILHRMELDIFPVIGKRPIKDITAIELLDTLRKIEKRGAHEMAHRALQMCGQVFRYAVVTGRTDRNPAADLKGALKPVKRGHFAALDEKELPNFLKALEHNEARLYAHTRLAMKLMVLTFVRTSELIGAKWAEIDWQGKRWIIPAERMKMKREHIVPLSRQALIVLKELQHIKMTNDFVFPSQIRSDKHMSNNTILKALERMGYKKQATGHGFRAVAMSLIKERLGYRHEVPDRQLAHVPKNKVDAAYDRAKFLDERTRMMQEWADYLDGLNMDRENVFIFRQSLSA